MRAALWVAMVGATLVVAAPAAARRNVRGALGDAPALAGLPELATPQYRNAADAVLKEGVRNMPIHAAGSYAYTYRYDPDCDCYQRATGDFGPWFVTERAEPIGEGLFGIAVLYGWYDLHGCNDFDRLSFSSGAIDARAGIERQYSVTTFTFTYGITRDLDVSLSVPVAWLDFGVNYFARGGTTGGTAFSSQHFTVGPNVMDMLTRAKYRVFEAGGFSGALGLQAWLPTGDVADGFGTGEGEVGPFLALSTSQLQGWVDSHWNAGFDVAVARTQRSSAHYSWGIDVQHPPGSALDRFSLTGQIVGRSEIAGIATRASVSGPHLNDAGEVVNSPYLCLDPDRHDYVDVILGFRMRVVRSLVFTFGAFKAVNEGVGVRTHGWSPVAGLEAVF